MKEIAKLYSSIDQADLHKEQAINEMLQRKGFYSKSHGFPLASLQLELTSHCNMLCKHCYNQSGDTAADLMTPEKWMSFAKYLVNKGGVFECIISGGEPLILGKDLFRIMDIFHNDGSLFMFLTNGYLLNENNVEVLKNYKYHWIQISIDGVTAEYHDSFRQKSGSWEHAVRGAKLVSHNGLPLKIAHCVTPENILDIDEMCSYALSLGATCITIGELCLSGRTAKHMNLLLSESERKYMHEKICENAQRYYPHMKVKSSNSIRKGLERHLQHPHASAVIRPNGDIRIDAMAPFVIGNILSDDFSALWTERASNCWHDPRVLEYIKSFSADDRNYHTINYITEDIHL